MKESLERLFQSDNRAVAPVLGVALLFAIAAIALSAWQTTVIPQQNKEVEFDHYGDIREDMGDLRQAHQEVATSGEPQSPTLRLGASYRPRVFGVNPPNPLGSVETESLGSYEIQGAPSFTSGEDVTTGDVCGEPNPETVALRYDPSYNRLSDDDTPPIVYENTVTYREGLSPETTQVLIQGSNINILPVQSEVQRSSPTTSLTLASEGFQVEKDLKANATPILLVPTDISDDTWRDELLTPSSNPYVTSVTQSGDRVAIQLANLESQSSSRWTVRCAITTTGETSSVPQNLDRPPFVQNGGFGRGGITEHTVDSNTDTVTLPNGKWIEIDSISELNFLGADTTAVAGDDDVSGEGIAVEYKISDGRSDEVVYLKVGVTRNPDGTLQDKVVKMGPPGDYQDAPTLTDRAAKKILENGDVNVLDPANYEAETFDTQDGNFGAYVQDVKRMEGATIQTTDLQGRVDMEVLTGDLTLDVENDDERQTYVEGNTSEISFDVTASGTTDAPENVDLKVSQSGSDGLVEPPRSDRETIDLDGGSEEFTLTWEPDWNDVGGGTYDVLMEGETDQSFASVRVIQEGGAFVEVETLDHNAPVEYGDDLIATVQVENVGDTEADDTIELSVADSCCPNEAKESVNLDPGESKNVTLTYDTGELDTDSTGEVTMVAQSSNYNSKDSREVEITEPTIIEDPTVEDIQAGQERVNQTMGFRLGEDTGQASIKIDLSDTGDAVSYNTNSDAHWTVVEGDGSISLNTNNDRVTSVIYTTSQSSGLEGERIRIAADYTDTTDAEVNSIVKYDVPFELTSADNYPAGETNSTTFETTLGEHIDIEIVDPGMPVEYGENFTATVRVENEGSAAGDEQIQLSLDGVTGPQETVQLASGESKNVTMTYDTSKLSSNSIGEADLEAETSDATDSRTVTIESPVIHEPFVEDVPANESRLNQTMGFTLGAETDGATIKMDLTDTGDDVSYDSDSDGNWTVVQGNGSISGLNTNNNRVTSVKYQTNSSHDLAGDRIRIAANYTDSTDAEPGVVYDVEYELTSANNYPAGETDSTSFGAT